MNDRQSSISDLTLPRSERLRSLRAVRLLFAEGKGGFVYPFRYMCRVERRQEPVGAGGSETVPPAGSVEVLFSVPKRFHKRANRRNLLKRRMREAYRLNRGTLREAVRSKGVEIDVALVYSVKECLSYKCIEDAVQRILERIRTRL